MQKGVCWEVTQTVTQSGLQAPELSGTFLPSPGARGDRRGRPPWTKLSVSPCPFPSLLFPHPLSQGPPLVSCHQTGGSSRVGGGQTLLYPTPNGGSVPGPRPLCSFLRSVGSSPREAGSLLYSHRCAGGCGVWGGNTLGKVRPIPSDTHGQVTLGSCSPGPLPILITPTWERPWPGPGLVSGRYSTAPRPVVLPASRWTPGAGGACVSPVV